MIINQEDSKNMKTILLITFIWGMAMVTKAQQVYELKVPVTKKAIYTGHLKMGGKSPSGGSIDVNSFYMSMDGKPVIPVMGEFHYSRYPHEQWEEEIWFIRNLQ